MNILQPIEAPKDQWGRYKIVGPDGKTTGYTRVTTITKTISDSAALANWKTRMTVTGIIQRQDLLAKASTLLDDKKGLDRLCQEACDAAGANSRANLGTALHSITQKLDSGTETHILPGLQDDIAAYQKAVKTFGFITHNQFIETLVINDTLKYAGTADRFVTTPDGQLLVFDLKTGTSIDYSHLDNAQQLAAYANAEWIYDWRTNTRTPMPNIDKTVGIICHLPAGTGTCQFYSVNIADGFDILKISMTVRELRKRKDLMTKYVPTTKPAAATRPTTKTAAPATLNERQTWLTERIKALTQTAQRDLRLTWPDGCPPLAKCDNPQLDLIIKTVETVEAAHTAPFFTPDPTKISVGPALKKKPRPTIPAKKPAKPRAKK